MGRMVFPESYPNSNAKLGGEQHDGRQ